MKVKLTAKKAVDWKDADMGYSVLLKKGDTVIISDAKSVNVINGMIAVKHEYPAGKPDILLPLDAWTAKETD